MRFLSLFSGIEAASAAWTPLGWECAAVSEVDPFACAALAHHHPSVPNLGDVTKIAEMQIAALGHIDLVVFGSPCQDLSVAGKQKGLAGERSGLFFTAIRIIEWCRLWCGTRFALWENVPGAFSSNKGRDFATVVDALAGLDGTPVPPKGWGTEGCTVGPEAMVEWATLDAQWFGVAQRRRRVFALADFGDWASRQPILLEPQSMRGDTAPRREAGQAVAGGAAAGAGGGGGQAFGGNNTAGPIDVATARNACASASGLLDFESETFLVQPAHTLRGEGFDASEDGTGRGTPLVPVFLHANKGRPAGRQSAHTEMISIKPLVETLTTDGHAQSAVAVPIAFDTTQITSPKNYSRPLPGYPCHPLAAGAHAPAICFSAKDYGADATLDLAPTLRAGGHQDSHANAGVMPAIAFQSSQSDVRISDVHATLDANNGSRRHNGALVAMQVRRLTPVECERLQGFPDGHTAIPRGAKPAGECPGGPRYKALGNSMAVPVMRWIGQKLDVAVLFQGQGGFAP